MTIREMCNAKAAKWAMLKSFTNEGNDNTAQGRAAKRKIVRKFRRELAAKFPNQAKVIQQEISRTIMEASRIALENGPEQNKKIEYLISSIACVIGRMTCDIEALNRVIVELRKEKK